jgi:hypothetical protein
MVRVSGGEEQKAESSRLESRYLWLYYLDHYVYLGFPVTDVGIDFKGHLTGRLDRVLGRAAFLTLHSDR